MALLLIRNKACHVLELLSRFLEATELKEEESELVVSLPVARVCFDSLAQAGLGLVEAVLPGVDLTEPRQRVGIR